ncbi:phosphodiesterase [Corynebacterium sp. BCW_4722]|nr:phosphodiesterase [Corynebacterium sp. BCW_4722]
MTESSHEQQPKRGFSRRSFLRTTAVATGAAGAAQLASNNTSQAQSSLRGKPKPVEMKPRPLPFVHGVASGDPLPTAVVIWTRVTPEPDAKPGSGKGAPTRLKWEVATDFDFKNIVKQGEVTSNAKDDHTIHVDVQGLDSSAVYYYRFTVVAGQFKDAVSPVGRTKTAPKAGAKTDRQRWAIASCANWESGFFSAYADLAERGWKNDIDLTVFLGDYIYEYKRYEYAGNGPVRLHEPPHETVTLADYRTRYGHHRTDPALANAHASMPWIVVWDDHEVADNNWREGAYNHQPNEGSFTVRRDAAMKAYFEWMPVRPTETSEKGRLYRNFTFGDLVELTIMDLRTYRDIEYSFATNPRTDPNRTMLGSEQYKWVERTIQESNTKWNALGNSVMFSPLYLGAVYADPQTRPIAEALSSNIPVINAPLYEFPLNGDQWDGYDRERRSLINLLGSHKKNPIFLTGDIHTEWAHNVEHDGKKIGCEVVCSSITAPNAAESVGIPAGSQVYNVARHYLHAANPKLRHVALDTHGYAVVTIRPEEVDMEWMRVDNILAPVSPVRSKVALTWRKGKGFTS